MTHEPESKHQYLRQRKLIDVQLQGSLLVALVLLEVSMLVGATCYLYWSFSGIIDANLFVIHRSNRVELLPEFLKHLGWTVLVMSIANTWALMLAHLLWNHHVKKVVRDFRARLHRIASLNLSPVDGDVNFQHSVIDNTDRWRQQEQQRLLQIRQQVDQIVEQSSCLDHEPLIERLNGLRVLLKPTSRVTNSKN